MGVLATDFFQSEQYSKQLWLLLALGPALLASRAQDQRASRRAGAPMSAPVARPVPVVMLIESLDFDPGGAERLVLALATRLPRERFDVTVCTTRAVEGELLQQLRAAGVRHLPLNRRSRADLLAWRRLTRFLRRERVQILHAHMWGSNFWGSLLGRGCRVPVVIAHEHTWAYRGKPYRRLLDGYVIGRLAHLFLTVANKQLMVDWEHVPERKVRGDAESLHPAAVGQRRQPARRAWHLAPETPVVGTIARLRPQKAIQVLLDAFAQLSHSLPQAQLVIAGDGPCRGGWSAKRPRRASAIAFASSACARTSTWCWRDSTSRP